MCPPNERAALVTPEARRKTLNDFVIGTSLAHADFMRDESIAVHAASVREAITLEFGPGALRVLGDSQAWFRERVRRFLEEGADPAF